MARCDVCGNDYDKAFEVVAAGRHYIFDSFQCAIHRVAPVCEHCGCKVLARGVEVGGHFYCCDSCGASGPEVLKAEHPGGWGRRARPA